MREGRIGAEEGAARQIRTPSHGAITNYTEF
jgi:hypothetical protein